MKNEEGLDDRIPAVPYDNDPRPLNKVRKEEGPNPTQDGPYRGRTAPPGANDLMEWLNAKSPLFNYLGPQEDKAVKG